MKGGMTYTPVTRARSAFARRTPALTPFRDSREPSVGRRMCLNIRQLLEKAGRAAAIPLAQGTAHRGPGLDAGQ
jgi:hypothetical protein